MSGPASDGPSSGESTGGADHAAAAGVKARLKRQLAGDPRLRGVGLSGGAATGGFQVEVRVGEAEHIAELALPASVDGVPVRVRAVGDVTAAPPG